MRGNNELAASRRVLQTLRAAAWAHNRLLLIAASLCCVLLGACAPLSEQERFARADRLNVAREDYARKAAACRSVGGTMRLKTTPLAKTGYRDYETAICVQF